LAEVCSSCEAEVKDEAQRFILFGTTYVGGERADYFGWYCPYCAESLVRSLELKEET
jgi:hypothetical protein